MGVLKVLNQKLSYDQIWSGGEQQKVTLPFFFDFASAGSSEKFIQDNYMHWTDTECTEIGLKKIDGDFKTLPYGVLSLESSSINSGEITNRFVMGRYDKSVGGQYRSFVSFIYSIPLQVNFSVNIISDTVNTMWKIEQSFREYFYKNKTIRVNYKGFAVPVRIGFPESITANKTNQYVIGQNTDGQIKQTFSLTCETYQPVPDPFTERPAENVIKHTSVDLTMVSGVDGKEKGRARIETVPVKRHITTEEDVLLQWTFEYGMKDLLDVDILYKEEGDSDYTLIETVPNHNCYHLQIQDDFVENPTLFDLIVPHNDGAVMVTVPELKIWADPDTKMVTKDQVSVKNKGYIITDSEYITGCLSYQIGDNYIEKEIQIHIVNNMVDTEHPVEMDDFIYTGPSGFRRIQLFIRDHARPEIIAPFQADDEWIYVH